VKEDGIFVPSRAGISVLEKYGEGPI